MSHDNTSQKSTQPSWYLIKFYVSNHFSPKTMRPAAATPYICLIHQKERNSFHFPQAETVSVI